MKNDMLDLCAWTIEQARQAGANQCKVTVSRSRSVDLNYRERKPETVKEATEQSLSLHVYAEGKYSAQGTADLRKESLRQFVANAVATTRLLAEDPHRSLPDPKYYEGRATLDLTINDPTYPQWSPDARHALARAVEEACLTTGGDKVISVTAGVYDEFHESAVMSSNGLEGVTSSTGYSAGATMTARDAGDRRPAGYYYVAARNRQSLPDAALVGRTAATRTLAMLGAKKVRTETLPIIIENQSVARVLRGLVGALSGSAIQQKRSFLADKKELSIASPQLTLVDDPLLIAGLASGLYDGDGFASRRRTVLEAGVLKEFYVDWYYSRKLGWEPTTGGSSNLLIPPGRRSVPEIMKDLGRGILVNGFLGGNSNSTTGDFSVGISGQLFENGQPVQAVAEMNIADNHLSFWSKLIETANDPWTYSSWRMPSLVFRDVVVAGA
jgi:PmbA protein